MSDNKKKHIRDMLDRTASIADPGERSRKYRNVVATLSFDAVRSNDMWYIEEALKTARLVTDDTSMAYVDVIRAMAKMGTNNKDEKKLYEALEITGLIDNPLSKSVSLHAIVTALGKVAIEKNDEKLLEAALYQSTRIPLITYRSSALRNISRHLSATNPGKAQELLDAAIELIEENKDIQPIFRVFAYCDIASLLAIFNDSRSSEFIKRSIAIADNIADDFERSAILLKIVEVEIAIGNKKNDKIMLNDALAISKIITKEYYKTLAHHAIHNT